LLYFLRNYLHLFEPLSPGLLVRDTFVSHGVMVYKLNLSACFGDSSFFIIPTIVETHYQIEHNDKISQTIGSYWEQWDTAK